MTSIGRRVVRWASQDDAPDEMTSARVLRAFAAAVQAHGSIVDGLTAAAATGRGPLQLEIGRCVARCEAGVPLRTSLAELADETRLPLIATFASMLAIAHRDGGDLADPAYRCATLLHGRAELRRDVGSATAAARASARGVVFMPMAVVAFWALHSPSSLRAFVWSPAFFASIPGVVLVGVGSAYVMRVAARAGAIDSFMSERRLKSRDAGAVLGSTVMLIEQSCALHAAGFTAREIAESVMHEGASHALTESLRDASRQVILGMSVFRAMRGIPECADAPVLAAWVAALEAEHRTGVSSGPVLEALLADAREQVRSAVRSQAVRAGPRIQLATALMLVPGIVWIVLIVVGQRLMGQLAAAGIAA